MVVTRQPDDVLHDVTSIHPFGIVISATEPGLSVSDIDVPSLRKIAREHHLLLLRGFQTFDTADDMSAYCQYWGELSQWPFGTVLELVEREEPEDHIFDHRYVPLHWDGMYREHVPEFQVFSCVLAPGPEDGGETTFSDTSGILRNIDKAVLDQWAEVTGIYRRRMEYYDSVTISPLVTTHPDTGKKVIRYNEPTDLKDTDFVNHPDLGFVGLPGDQLTEVHTSLRKALYSPEHFYAHTWQTGDLVVADNYSLLHGRNAFTSHAPRHLRRVHVLGEPPLINPALLR